MNDRVCCWRESLRSSYRVNMEALLRAIILEDEEDDDLLIYCRDPSGLLRYGYQGLILTGKGGRRVKLTIHIHPG